MRLALDSLSAGLLLLFIVGASCSVTAGLGRRRLPALAVLLAGTLLILLAANAVTVLVGVTAIGLTGWLGRHENARLQLAATSVAIGCLIAGFAVAGNGDFAALRAASPVTLPLDVATVLMLAGAIALLPWHLWRGTAVDELGVLSAASTFIVVFYLLVRVMFDLFGTAQLTWCGIGLVIAGAASGVIGSLRAAVEDEIDTVVLTGSLHQFGLVLVGLGLALIARGVDLPSLTALALDAASLQFVCLVLSRVLLLQGAMVVRSEAGTRRIDLLGGLIHGMPIISYCMLAALLATVALPPSLGFAGLWLLFQALLGVARAGGFGLQCLLALAVGCIGVSIALAAVGTVRLFGVAFLSRPRTPRAAAAEDVSHWVAAPSVLLATLLVLLGLMPVIALWPLRAAIAHLSGASDDIVRPLLVSTGEAMPGYTPLSVAALLLLGAGGALWLLRRFGPAVRSEPAWSGGFAQPPAWLPFGDPATQMSARSFTESLRRFAHLDARAACGRLRETMQRAHLPSPVIVALCVLVAALITWLIVS
jgi:hydrogenase-4 component B